jgi:hypothetical protein
VTIDCTEFCRALADDTRRKDGKQVYYSLNHDNVVSCCGRLMAKFDAAADCQAP